jgi:hypothetical protein
MTITSADHQEQPDGEAERQADAMKAQLSKDVASWSASRSDGAARQEASLAPPAAKPATPPPARRAKPKAAAVPVPPAAPAGKKPFGMSYDGVTQTDYIAYMIARGVR